MRLFLAILLAFSLQPLEFVHGQAQSMVVDLPNIAALKARNVLGLQTTANVKGWVSAGDGGGGTFEYNAASNVAGDGGIVIVPNIGGGRWIRKVAGREYIARWWGPNKTNATLQAAINWVSANGWGTVIADGGTWLVKSDDSTRITMKSGVTLKTSQDSEIVCAPNPADNWILIDFPLDVTDVTIGPARLVGWNLASPGGDANKTGLIFSLQDTHNVTIGGVRASNWYTQYADVGSGNENLQMFDQDWQLGAMSFGATGLGPPYDDTKNLQSYAHFCERYGREFFMRPTTNGYYTSSVYFTNGPVRIRGESTLLKVFYSNPTEGVLPHYSSAFTISADNCSIDGLKFQTVGSYPVTETNQITSGFFQPIVIHLATNTVIRNCEFDVESGKGIGTSGSFTKIQNSFFNRCGITAGLGNASDWLFYEAASPSKGQKYSPLSVSVTGCTFVNGSPYKHTVFFSAADDFLFADNKMLEMNTPYPLLVYTGDEGTTDSKGTNVYKFGGKIINNTISGTNFGDLHGAISIQVSTPTNYVAPTFDPYSMYSAVLVQGNHIFGLGTNAPNSNIGIRLLSAKDTRIAGNNYVQTAGSPLWLVGNNDRIIVENNYLECTTLGIAGTIVFSEGFLQPPSNKDIIFRYNKIITPVSDEYTIRNIEPIYVENFTLLNNDFIFNGEAGSGDPPRVIQLTKSQGYVDISYNTFYLTNTMSNRRVAFVTGTNSDTTFSFNRSKVRTGAAAVLRGASISGKTVQVMGNNVGGMEFNDVTDLSLMGNLLTANTNGIICLEIAATVDKANIVGNTISNYSTIPALCVSISATNATFDGNLVSGNSSSEVVRIAKGKTYVGNNVIRNKGAGVTYPVATAGTISHIIYERPLHVDIGSIADSLASFHRAGSPTLLSLSADNYFTGSSRDGQLHNTPDTASDIGGWAFFAHKTDGTEQFGFGVHGFTPLVFYIGDPTNSINTFIGGLGTNTLLYLDNDRYLHRLPLGPNMTFTNGVLDAIPSAGGASIPTGTGFLHTVAGVQDAAAKLVDTADINALQVTSAKLASGIDATKIAGGGVTSSEFDFIGTLTSDAQTQINTKISATSTDTLTGKTFDASASGNVLKTKGYLKFNFPRRVDGVGCTIPNTNDFTLPTFMVPRFNGTGATNDNFCRFAIRVPEDLDTAVVPTASLTVRLTGADTGAQIYNIGFASVANSAVSQATVGTWIKLDIAADASGASDDVESVNNVALTGWNSGLTAQRWWVIELNRAGATDASTVASELLELEIKFGSTQ